MKPSLEQIKFAREAELIEDFHIYRRPIVNLILAAALRPSFLGSERDQPRLQNDDVAKLAAGRLPESVIIRAIELYESDFDTSQSAVMSLCESGVGINVIEAMSSKKSGTIPPTSDRQCRPSTNHPQGLSHRKPQE